jgi:hypothetical protein
LLRPSSKGAVQGQQGCWTGRFWVKSPVFDEFWQKSLNLPPVTANMALGRVVSPLAAAVAC